MARKIQVEILGDARSLEAALGRAQQKTSKFGSALAAGAKVGAAGLLGLGVAAKIGFDELTDSQRVAAQTAAVLKSTGGAANVTAKQVAALAQSLLAKSGVDDETIASGENLLLTFRNISNEVGKGNDVFNQATKATLDLSVAMGKDMKSSALVVGKALNDPIRGLTALRRVGVQFSSAQEDLIKHLVNTGHTMQAQKIILGELNKEFGGSAQAAGQTLPAQLSKLRESFADVAANLVGALLPATSHLISVLATATGWMKRNQTATQVLVGAIAALSVGLIAAKAAYALANSALIRYVTSERVAAAASKALAVATWLVNAALTANPVVLITAGIIAFGVALVVAYKKSKTFRDVVHAAMSAVVTVVGFVVDRWKQLFGIIEAVIGKIRDAVSIAKSAANAIGGVFSGGGPNNYKSPTNVKGGSNPPAKNSARPIHVQIKIGEREFAQAIIDTQRGYGRQNAGRVIIGTS